jgi:hypothetical protein
VPRAHSSGHTSYFTTDDQVLWQVRLRGDGAGAERTQVMDGAVGHPEVVLDADRRLELFVRRVEGMLWHAWQGPNGAWQIEQLADRVTDDPAVVLSGDRLVFFVRRADGWLWRYWQTAPGPDGWTATRVAEAAAGRPGAASDRAADGALRGGPARRAARRGVARAPAGGRAGIAAAAVTRVLSSPR